MLLKEALAANRTIYGEDDRRVADVLDSLAKIRRAQTRPRAKRRHYAQPAVDVQIKAEGPGSHCERRTTAPRWPRCEYERREYAQAEAQLRAARVTFEKTLVADHPTSPPRNITWARSCCNRSAEGCRSRVHGCDEQIEARQRARVALGTLRERLWAKPCIKQGRAREAETYLVNSYRTLSTDENADPNALKRPHESG